VLKTSSLVVAETQALLARRIGMAASIAFLDQVAGPASDVMIWVSEDLYRAAVALWLRRDIREPLSVTDAVSFEVMRREKMREAFAFDGDFERAGYKLV
jgi:predicted nucleic acid-binding protein